MKSIRLKKRLQAYSYEGNLHYLISHDNRSGMQNVYTVFVLNADDPVTIGRELDLKTVRKVIERWESIAPKDWVGDRLTVLNIKGIVNLRVQNES